MTFDKPEHKEIIKQLLNAANYPGHMVELIVEVKRSVEAAADGSARPVSTDAAVPTPA